jgi:hypothetical protein
LKEWYPLIGFRSKTFTSLLIGFSDTLSKNDHISHNFLLIEMVLKTRVQGKSLVRKFSNIVGKHMPTSASTDKHEPMSVGLNELVGNSDFLAFANAFEKVRVRSVILRVIPVVDPGKYAGVYGLMQINAVEFSSPPSISDEYVYTLIPNRQKMTKIGKGFTFGLVLDESDKEWHKVDEILGSSPSEDVQPFVLASTMLHDVAANKPVSIIKAEWNLEFRS